MYREIKETVIKIDINMFLKKPQHFLEILHNI